jgi:hypothetical protein
VLKITKEGKTRVATLEFAEELEEFIANAKEGVIAGSDGLPVPQATAEMAVVVHVAAALAGKDNPDEFETDAELEELNRFMQENGDQINAAIGTCLRILKSRDDEGNPQNL